MSLGGGDELSVDRRIFRNLKYKNASAIGV